jgi:hypothetical protein
MAKNPFSSFPLLNHLTRDCPHLTDREKLVALTIALHRRANGTQLCNPTIRQLCKETNHCRQVILDTLNSLVRKLVITIELGAGKRPNHYTFLFDSEEVKLARERHKEECSKLPF